MSYKTKVLELTAGGSNASLTASNGGIVYTDATKMAVLASTSTANQPLLSGASGAPGWSTATYPGSTTQNRILYSSANNVVGQITSANSGVLSTNSSGVPSIDTTNFAVLTTGLQLKGNNTNTAPPSGFIGEQIVGTRSSGSAQSLSNGTPADMLASPISLTAGIWDISLIMAYSAGAITATVVYAGISANSASFTGTVDGNSLITSVALANAGTGQYLIIPSFRVLLSSTTSYYAVARCDFTVGSASCYGRMSAVRVG